MFQKIGSNLLLFLFIGSSVATSGIAGYKIIKKLPTVTASETISAETDTEMSITPTATKVPQQSQRNPQATITPTGSTQQTGTVQVGTSTSVRSSSTVNAAVQPAQGCIITLSGNQYNVDSLRNSHPGGNIFVCGTDMTARYTKQHGTNTAQMARYLVQAGSTSTIQTNTDASLTPVSQSSEERREHEDELESEDETEETEKLYEQRDENNEKIEIHDEDED